MPGRKGHRGGRRKGLRKLLAVYQFGEAPPKPDERKRYWSSKANRFINLGKKRSDVLPTKPTVIRTNREDLKRPSRSELKSRTAQISRAPPLTKPRIISDIILPKSFVKLVKLPPPAIGLPIKLQEKDNLVPIQKDNLVPLQKDNLTPKEPPIRTSQNFSLSLPILEGFEEKRVLETTPEGTPADKTTQSSPKVSLTPATLKTPFKRTSRITGDLLSGAIGGRPIKRRAIPPINSSWLKSILNSGAGQPSS